ncbi:3-deoxy-7-phosphoheptulonate synthase [Puniceicoccales bacterium CK1056]|uniref:3-deoxy-7-phosphoheptulonate synthase n=1 Tax=Oceanipulchritudo coccoides TaxID=2706888 RepID=A0A6B2M3H6_9BACT|nr:3-deoxy-7-phosphoheptulonate synthase [Oceanipulchritudo coccoides]NDV62365.1 3-deoxy-7-phosphoheptulonate synthase [Oceanipulchritudo coccoides]
MIIVLKPKASKTEADEILSKIEAKGLKPLYMPGSERTVIGALGDERLLGELHLESHPSVERVDPILAPYKAVSREMHPEDSIVKVGSLEIGGSGFAVIAGPCAVESYEQMSTTAKAVAAAGAHGLRGGAFKPRTSPYSFQGLGLEGLKILKQVREETGLPVITEVVEVADVEAVEEYADAFQVGARNMQNFRLLTALGQAKKPVFLKRGMAATIKDVLMSAEYIAAEGNNKIILCERGIRTFETGTRNTLDLSAVCQFKQLSHLPVMIDPSHGTGVRDYVAPMAYAAAAAGADGILVEVHVDPKEALSDGAQSLYPEQFAELMKQMKPFAEAAGRKL